MTKTDIKSVLRYCRVTANGLEHNGHIELSNQFKEVAEILEKATPEALYLLFDTGIYNGIVKAYAEEAARIAGLAPSGVAAIGAGAAEALDEIAAEDIER